MVQGHLFDILQREERHLGAIGVGEGDLGLQGGLGRRGQAERGRFDYITVDVEQEVEETGDLPVTTTTSRTTYY